MKPLLFILTLICTTIAYSHGGKTDKNGGHNSKDGYHYHKPCLHLSTDETQLINLVRTNPELIKMLLTNNDYGDL